MEAVQADETVVAAGFRFPEGPSLGLDGALYVVELAGRRVSRVDLATGERSTLAELGGSPNGSAFGPDGRLYVCNSGGRWAPEASTGGEPGPGDGPGLVQRVSLDGRSATLIEEIDGVPLNGPNDICFGPDGGFWFTDPSWPDGEGAIGPGTVCYGRRDGSTVRCHTGLLFPNGLGVTGDGSTLVVAESGTFKLHAFPILGPGELGAPSELAALPEGAIPDGLCFDARGRVLCAGHGASSIYVVPAGGGEPEAVIGMDDEDVTNLCFGGPDFRTLYVTESDSGRVVRVEWEERGMVLFPDR